LISAEKPAAKGPVQLDLFNKAENKLIEELTNTDISRMTPLEALNYLNELQEKLKT
jgi:DNA mismatch repair protein MutS